MDGCFYLLYLHFFYEYKTLILRYIQKRLLNIDNMYNFSSGHSSFNSPIQRYTNFSSSEVSADRHK